MSAHAPQAFSIARCTNSEDLPQPLPPHCQAVIDHLHRRQTNITLQPARKDYRIGTLRCNWPMSAHASQAFSTSTVPIRKIYLPHFTCYPIMPLVAAVNVSNHPPYVSVSVACCHLIMWSAAASRPPRVKGLASLITHQKYLFRPLTSP